MESMRISVFSSVMLITTLVLQALVLSGTRAEKSILERQLAAVFVVHRHGARWPMPSVNASAVCGAKCGMLNPTGATMLSALGAAVRARYSNNPSTNASFPRRYDPRTASSSSSDAQRTVQSADYFVRSLFQEPMAGSGPDVAPVIQTDRLDENRRLLVWTGWPSLVAWSTATADAFNAWCVNATLQLATPQELDHIISTGADHGIGAECPPRNQWPDPNVPPPTLFQCALDLQDMWESMSAELSDEAFMERCPQLHFLSPLLNRFAVAYNNYSWYRRSDPWWRALGAKGYYLVQDIATRATAAIAAATTSPSPPPVVAFHEYSGHDITLMPLAESIGNDTLQRPRYAGAMIFEVWVAPSSPLSQPTIKAFYGEPQRPPGANGTGPYHYDFEPSPLRCASQPPSAWATGDADDSSSSDASASIVTVSLDGCPFDQWLNFLRYRYPAASDDPACFVADDYLAPINCTAATPVPEQQQVAPSTPPPSASSSAECAPPAGSPCAVYRQACPLQACNDGISLAAAAGMTPGTFNRSAQKRPIRGTGWDLRCIRFDYGEAAVAVREWRLAAWITVAVAIAALGACGVVICLRRRFVAAECRCINSPLITEGIDGKRECGPFSVCETGQCRPWWAQKNGRKPAKQQATSNGGGDQDEEDDADGGGGGGGGRGGVINDSLSGRGPPLLGSADKLAVRYVDPVPSERAPGPALNARPSQSSLRHFGNSPTASS